MHIKFVHFFKYADPTRITHTNFDMCHIYIFVCFFSIRLLADLLFIATPWHNVVVELLDGRKILMKRIEAEQMKCQPIYKHDRLWGYKQQVDDETILSNQLANTVLPAQQ
jgi:hypothetical protein